MFRIALNKLFERLFLLASHSGGLGSIPGRDMSVQYSVYGHTVEFDPQVEAQCPILLMYCKYSMLWG
jgi:hypothetical protein